MFEPILYFLGGWAWTCAGLEVLAIVDPEGEQDAAVMGEGDNASIVKFGLSLLFWPLVAIAIWWARRG